MESWFLPAKAQPVGIKSPLAIFFHGNGEVIDFLPDQLKGLSEAGLHLLLVEYPGYGRSSGKPGEAAIVEAAVAAYDAARQRPEVDAGRIIAIGRSLGAGAASLLSLERPLAALVLQSTFTSTRPFARKMLLPGFLARDVFDNLHAVQRFAGPILIAHGRHDDIIPFSHGVELAKAGRNVRFLELSCAHNDCPPDLDAFWQSVSGWLREKKVI